VEVKAVIARGLRYTRAQADRRARKKSTMLTNVPNPRARRGLSLRVDQYPVPIPDDAPAKRDRQVAGQRAAPGPAPLLVPEHVPLGASGRLMTQVPGHRDDGPGPAMLDSFLVERLSAARRWRICSVSSPAPSSRRWLQEWNGPVIRSSRVATS
jgi:hypothetical protein